MHRLIIVMIAGVALADAASPHSQRKPPIGAAQVNWQHPLTKGLVAQWLYNEAGGLWLADSASGAYSATKSADQVWVSGPRGPVLDSTAGSGAVTYPTLVTGSVFTWECRFLWHVVGSADYATFVSQGATKGIYFMGGTSNKLNYYQSGDLLSATALASETWHHAAIVVDGTSVRFYANGKLDGTGTTTSGGYSLTHSFHDGATAFRGRWDYQRIWRRALTPGEIQELYREPYLNSAPRHSLLFGPSGGSPPTRRRNASVL